MSEDTLELERACLAECSPSFRSLSKRNFPVQPKIRGENKEKSKIKWSTPWHFRVFLYLVLTFIKILKNFRIMFGFSNFDKKEIFDCKISTEKLENSKKFYTILEKLDSEFGRLFETFSNFLEIPLFQRPSPANHLWGCLSRRVHRG